MHARSSCWLIPVRACVRAFVRLIDGLMWVGAVGFSHSNSPHNNQPVDFPQKLWHLVRFTPLSQPQRENLLAVLLKCDGIEVRDCGCEMASVFVCA